MTRLFVTLLSVTALSVSATAASRSDLESWFARDLAPYVREQLTTHPRFRNESVRFVVMHEDSPQSEGSALAIDLRDRLRDSLSGVPGVRVVWQAEQPGVGVLAGFTGLDCTKNEASYFIGIELNEPSPGELTIDVRALDIVERSWVPGFGRSWRGSLSAWQRRELRTILSDPTFRGERHAPWNDSESDLMAAHLAYELGCSLLRQTAGEYVLAEAGTADDAASNPLVELVSNNLAGIPSLQFSSDGAASNALIEGKAHQIDDDLYQYWVTITPKDPTSALNALSADAYIRIPDRYAAAVLVPEAIYEFPTTGNEILSSLRVVRLRDQRSCLVRRTTYTDATMSRNNEYDSCFALQLEASDDAVVFFLNHQLNNGLVRLADASCSDRSTAKIARSEEALRFPLPLDSLSSGSWTVAHSWSLQPDKDTFYALASRNTKAARALSRHIEKLPKRCSASIRSGIEGAALRRWLEDLAAIVHRWESAIDWQSIHVKNVY